jgi:UDP-GlcNAc3NAcA epimerase
MNKKIVTIVGARPQFIKAAALSRAISKNATIKEIIIHTGQHFDFNMSNIFFEEMQIPRPKYQFNISGLSHGAMTGKMMVDIEEVVVEEKPDAILVYGDTNSTLAGALVGAKLHIPIIHVEAGLRSFNMNMPEEINRIITDRLSSILLCPTSQSITNLHNEGFNNFNVRIELVGDVMEDASLFYEKEAKIKSNILNTLNIKSNYVLVTCHRAENTDIDNNFLEIVKGLNQIAESSSVIWPVHPRIKEKIKSVNVNQNIILIDPVGYFDMINLIINSDLVLTDSGGLQKEAYFFNKFCITMREQTEWVELVDNHFNILTGANSNLIFEAYQSVKSKRFEKNVILYGGGMASENIARLLMDFLFSKN